MQLEFVFSHVEFYMFLKLFFLYICIELFHRIVFKLSNIGTLMSCRVMHKMSTINKKGLCFWFKFDPTRVRNYDFQIMTISFMSLICLFQLDNYARQCPPHGTDNIIAIVI